MRHAVLLFACTRLASAQTAPDQPTFRTGAREVLVDATVSDKQGNFPRDLTRSDFHLFEDGKEQTITSFALESNTAPGTRSPHFLAVLIEGQGPGLIDEIAAFADRFAAPDLYVALYSNVSGELRLQQHFTTDPERFKAALRATPAVQPGDPIRGMTITRIPMLAHMSSLAADLAPIHGRKALIVFGMSFFGIRLAPQVSPAQDASLGSRPMPAHPGFLGNQMQKVTDDCSKARVSIFAFALDRKAGLSTGDFYGTSDSAHDTGGSTDLLRDLAVATGGSYTPPGKYDLVSYLGGVVKQQSDYYLLGYAPPANSADTPCHKIKLKIDRPGLDINARDAFCSSGPLPPRGLKAPQRALEARIANPGGATAAMQLSWFHLKPDAAIVDVATDIDPAAWKLKGKAHAEFEALGIAYREDGSMAARLPDTVSLDFGSPAQRDELVKAPYHYSTQLTLSPGRYRFVLAAGSEKETVSQAERPLDIEPWSPGALSLSSLALGIKDRPVSSVSGELDAPLADGPHRLASKGRELEPMGSLQFPAVRDGIVYFEVYDPLSAHPVTLDMRVRDRATGQEKAGSAPLDASPWARPSSPTLPISLTLRLSSLPRGAYTLEVRAAHAGGKDAVQRTVDFEIK